MSIHKIPRSDRTLIVQVQALKEFAQLIAGIKVQEKAISLPLDHFVDHIHDDTIVCRCERVTAGEIRDLIQQGYRDINEIKAISRAGMGACGSKTCTTLIHRLFREQDVPINDVVDHTKRPLFVEVTLSAFAGVKTTKEGTND